MPPAGPTIGPAVPFDLFKWSAVDIAISNDMLCSLDALRWGRAELHTLVPAGEACVRVVIERWGLCWADDACLRTAPIGALKTRGPALAGPREYQRRLPSAARRQCDALSDFKIAEVDRRTSRQALSPSQSAESAASRSCPP